MNVAKTQLMVLSRKGRRDAANSVRVKVGEMDLERGKMREISWR